MARLHANPGRRRLIRLIATAAVVTPLGDTVRSGAAEAAKMINESDPAAIAVKYKAEATKALDRKDPKAFCDNCNYYTGKPGSANGACAVLGGKLVTAKGWCTSWEGY